MPFNGTYMGFEPGQWGGKVTIQTERGPWKMDNKTGGPPQVSPGTPVQFEAEKKGNFWHCKAITPAQAGPQQVGQGFQAPLPPQNTAPPVDHKAMEIFMTGVIGRCLQGTGTMPDHATLASMMQSVKGAWQEVMESKPAAVSQPSYGDSTGEPPPGHPAGWQ